MVKILAIYYSQTGQTRELTESILEPLKQRPEIAVDTIVLQPVPDFPYPWNSKDFFQAMPESVSGEKVCEILPFETMHEQYDLALFAYSPWFLSPSIPAHAFLQSEQAAKLLANTPVITVVGCRNMWIEAQKRVVDYFQQMNARLVGNIVFRDKAPNLVGVLSTIRWLMKGKKEKSRWLPAAGVSDADIQTAGKFGTIILNAINNGTLYKIQSEIIAAGGTEVQHTIAFVERNGRRIFGVWQKFIRKKGKYGDAKRQIRLNMFYGYLLFMLYAVSPAIMLLYRAVALFIPRIIRKQVKRAQYLGIFSIN
jgi:hypothetical protein